MIIDKDGLQLDSFSDIFNGLVTGFKNIYGEDINLEQNTADGQIIGIFSNAVYDLETILARIYNAFDPDFAEGHELDKILKLISSTRLPATKSTVDIEITVIKDVTLPADYTVKDDNNNEWVITQEQFLEIGTHTISFEAKEWGSVTALANTITKPVTILTEVTTINNPTNAIAGRDEETDTELRVRRNKLLGYRATSLISSIYGKILNLNGVIDAVIYENNTVYYDEAKDLPAHTMWIIIDGGEIDEIAKIIATDKTVGCGLKGSIETIYTEEFLRRNGTTRQHHHVVRFDRPTEKEIYVKLLLKRKLPTDLIDHPSIKSSLADIEFNIAQTITATELYSTIYTAGDNFIALEVELSFDGVTWVKDFLEAEYYERLTIAYDKIEINEA